MKSPAASAALAPLRRLNAEAFETTAARDLARARVDLLNARRAANREESRRRQALDRGRRGASGADVQIAEASAWPCVGAHRERCDR